MFLQALTYFWSGKWILSSEVLEIDAYLVFKATIYLSNHWIMIDRLSPYFILKSRTKLFKAGDFQRFQNLDLWFEYHLFQDISNLIVSIFLN